MAGARLESLETYFPQGGLSELGFKGGKPGGYLWQGDRLYAFYIGEKTSEAEGSEAEVRKAIVMTGGVGEWYAGARTGIPGTIEINTTVMLTDFVAGVQNDIGNRYKVAKEKLPSALADLDKLPDIEERPDPKSPKLDEIKKHPFE